MGAEERFDEIAQETAAKAAAVDCGVPEYIDGLGHIIELLQDSVLAAKEGLDEEEGLLT